MNRVISTQVERAGSFMCPKGVKAGGTCKDGPNGIGDADFRSMAVRRDTRRRPRGERTVTDRFSHLGDADFPLDDGGARSALPTRRATVVLRAVVFGEAVRIRPLRTVTDRCARWVR